MTGPPSILCLPLYDEQGASSRYRIYQYVPHLRAAGFEVTVEPLFDASYLDRLYTDGSRSPLQVLGAYLGRVKHLLGGDDPDIIFLEKEALPYLPEGLERALIGSDAHVVVDLDDAVFHRYDRSSNPLVRRTLGDKFGKILGAADFVLAGNRYLAEHAERAGAERIETLPTVVDLARYPNQPPAAADRFTVGWIGSPSTVKYLSLVAPALLKVLGDADRLLVIGAEAEDVPVSGVPIETRPWSLATEIDDIADMDVGIMPLGGDAWDRGKCGLKLIQYMAAFKPTVASPVGANEQIVDEGTTGLFASSTDEWIEALEALKSDEKRRASMGLAGRDRVASTYSLEVTAPRMIELLEELLE